MMLVQSVVNSFGSETLAGFSAAMRIESLCGIPMIGIGNVVPNAWFANWIISFAEYLTGKWEHIHI